MEEIIRYTRKRMGSNFIEHLEVKVGTGITMLLGIDKYPYTVTKILTPRKIEVQEDTYTQANGFDMYSNQVYNFKPNLNGEKRILSLRKNSIWKQIHTNSPAFYVGRDAYQDVCF